MKNEIKLSIPVPYASDRKKRSLKCGNLLKPGKSNGQYGMTVDLLGEIIEDCKSIEGEKGRVATCARWLRPRAEAKLSKAASQEPEKAPEDDPKPKSEGNGELAPTKAYKYKTTKSVLAENGSPINAGTAVRIVSGGQEGLLVIETRAGRKAPAKEEDLELAS